MPTTRRAFLKQATAAAGLPAHALAAIPSRIIDTHTHFYDPTRPQGVPWPPKNDPILYKPSLPARFDALVRPLGVTGTIVIESNALLEDNQWVLDLAKDNPIIKGFMGHLEAGQPGFRTNLARFARNRLFRGIRLNGRAIAAGLTQPAFLDDLRRMADLDLALDAIGDPPLYGDLVTLTDRVQNFRVIVDHMPLDMTGGEAARARDRLALLELGRRPQVYSKVSGVLRQINGRVPDRAVDYKNQLDELWTTFGPDRLVYGSNWPVSDRVAPYATVLQVVREYFAAKGAEAQEKYFWRNSVAFYKWAS
jgi:predicted TIM-barrel fold metal-dependent hydrolase